jgi:hypothetical protein
MPIRYKREVLKHAALVDLPPGEKTPNELMADQVKDYIS